jgi:hypothetical protein
MGTARHDMALAACVAGVDLATGVLPGFVCCRHLRRRHPGAAQAAQLDTLVQARQRELQDAMDAPTPAPPQPASVPGHEAAAEMMLAVHSALAEMRELTARMAVGVVLRIWGRGARGTCAHSLGADASRWRLLTQG